MHASDQVFTMEREFTADCRLLAKTLPELIGLDGSTTAVAEGVVRRFLGMHADILARVEESTQRGDLPPTRLVNAANVGMKRLLEIAALNQRSAVEYLRALHRERTLFGTALDGALSDDEAAAVISGGASLYDLMDDRDRSQAGLAALPAPDGHFSDPVGDPLESALLDVTFGPNDPASDVLVAFSTTLPPSSAWAEAETAIASTPEGWS